ncbi:putative coagulation factor 5 8 type domain-containing protein [Diaporthe ampelina]|uniref:Putative coagulation factor 5 8 type domain-containing protein n=1 Tax=Diaporthe ampelina TaxID=1214573 RepID=A0A0G2FWJ8_9PEZI|nr:putative coagulation factor 5 8 type domain-containing protein [Diaporthe ampelina]
MRYYALARALLFQILICNVLATNIRSLFLFKDVLKSNTSAIKTSGFNTLIIFGVGVLENGDIMYYSNTPGSTDVLIASDGAYVGGTELSDKVRSFKTDTTDVDRVEISMNAQHIKELVASPGTGSSTRLYRNFAALKEAWGLDAVNNDDESIYDVDSTVAFGRMLGDIGYKYTISPYINFNFWESVLAQLNSDLAEPDRLLDRIYLQCYDGGDLNDPASWQVMLSMKVVPILWVVNNSKPVYGVTLAEAQELFSGWQSESSLAGGGYWNDYDIEDMGSSYTDYGDVLKDVFP